MTTKTPYSKSLLPCLALGAALALGASGAGAFPFFQATNGGGTTTSFGTPSFGLALNNAFDPVVLFISFVDVEVELIPGAVDGGTIGVFDPEDADRLTARGDVAFTYGLLITTEAEADAYNSTHADALDLLDTAVVVGDFVPQFGPDTDFDTGTGYLDLDLYGLQYDTEGNFFFVDGPAFPSPGEGGDAEGYIEIETVSGDLTSTPFFAEAFLDAMGAPQTQCTNFAGYTPPAMGSTSVPGNLDDTFCEIVLGLNADNDTPKVVKFFLDQPILEEDLPPLECFPSDGEGGPFCEVPEGGIIPLSTASFAPAATDPTGQIIGMFDHGACDPFDPANTGFGPSSGRVDCTHYYGQPTNAGPAGKFTTFTPNRVSAPATLALLGLGLALAARTRRRLA